MIQPEALDALMSRFGFGFNEANEFSRLYVDRLTTKTAFIIDNNMFEASSPRFSYLEYTSWQNRLMHQFGKLYRLASQDQSSGYPGPRHGSFGLFRDENRSTSSLTDSARQNLLFYYVRPTF